MALEEMTPAWLPPGSPYLTGLQQDEGALRAGAIQGQLQEQQFGQAQSLQQGTQVFQRGEADRAFQRQKQIVEGGQQFEIKREDAQRVFTGSENEKTRATELVREQHRMDHDKALQTEKIAADKELHAATLAQGVKGMALTERLAKAAERRDFVETLSQLGQLEMAADISSRTTEGQIKLRRATAEVVRAGQQVEDMAAITADIDLAGVKQQVIPVLDVTASGYAQIAKIADFAGKKELATVADDLRRADAARYSPGGAERAKVMEQEVTKYIAGLDNGTAYGLLLIIDKLDKDGMHGGMLPNNPSQTQIAIVVERTVTFRADLGRVRDAITVAKGGVVGVPWKPPEMRPGVHTVLAELEDEIHQQQGGNFLEILRRRMKPVLQMKMSTLDPNSSFGQEMIRTFPGYFSDAPSANAKVPYGLTQPPVTPAPPGRK